MKGRNVPPKQNDLVPVHVSSGYGHNTRQPFVELQISTFTTQMSPAKAREIALYLLEAADAGESDGFVVEFVQQKLDFTTEQSVQLLRAFRKHRLKARGEEADTA